MSYIGNLPTSVAFLTDSFSGTGSATAFTMSAAPANTASIIVAVSGVLQDPTTYSVNGLTLTFSAAPPSGTGNISVRYLGIPASGVTTTAYRTVTEFTATAGQTTFTPPSYTVGFIDVLRNGVRLGSADYTATNGTTVVLTAGASVGDLVTVVSMQVGSVLNAIPATVGAVNSTYLLDGAVTTSKITDGSVTPVKLVAGAQVGPVFYGRRSSNQSFSNSTDTKFTMDTAEIDTHSGFNAANNRYVIPAGQAGSYMVVAAVYFRSSGSACNQFVNRIKVNGSQVAYSELDMNGGVTVWGHTLLISKAMQLVAGDYIELNMSYSQNTYYADKDATFLFIQRVR